MKNLVEIANIIRHVRIRTTDILTSDKRKKTNANLLFDKILAGDFKTDNEAAQYFFNTDANSSNYKNLKRSLREKIINTLFFIKPNTTHSDYEKAYLYCSKNMFAASTLLFLQANNAGINLCIKVLSKAKEYELTEFIIDASRYLRLHYAVRAGNKKKFELYNKTYKEYLEIRRVEIMAEEYYCKLILPKVQNKSNDESTYHEAMKSYEDLKPYMEKYTSPFLLFIGNYIHIIALMARYDYRGTIEVCKKVIKFFEEKNYTYRTPLRVFLHNQLVCHTQLKEYENGKLVVEKSNNLVSKGTYSWFQNNELNLILALHSKNYQDAFEIFENSFSQSKFKTLPPMVKEQWLIYESYIHFLSMIGLVVIPENRRRRFKLGRFLNSIPTYSKDKRGLNIPILVIQILYMIINKDYDKSIDRIEAIEKYCSRYLTNQPNLRSSCFIKMLLQIPVSYFHKAGVERRVKKYLTKLLENPLHISNQPREIEIIPYEDLWGFVMQSLDKKTYSLPNRFNKRKRE